MAGQGLSRRTALRYMAMGAVASQFAGFERWSYAHEHKSPVAKATGKPYKIQFFAASEYAVILALTERIIPTDDSPGAREAGVAEFLDFLLSVEKPALQSDMRTVVQHANAMAYDLFDKNFASLSALEQDQAITKLMNERKKSFDLIRNYTVMGYFNSKVGMEYLDVPFLKNWSEGTDCKHADPEHRQVQV